MSTEHLIETKLGPISLVVNSATNLHVGLKPFTLHRAEYTGGFLNLMLSSEGWVLYRSGNDASAYYSLHLNSRSDGNGRRIEVSHAAREKVKQIVISAVTEWLTAHPKALIEGQKKSLDDEISRVQTAIHKLEQEVERERTNIHNLKRERERL